MVLTADPGFTLFRDPDTVRAPDVAYLQADRIPTVEVVGFDELAPDLAVEVLSPGDRPGAVKAKIDDWLTAGTELVWVIDPRHRLATVCRLDRTVDNLTDCDSFEGDAMLPGFTMSLSGILAP